MITDKDVSKLKEVFVTKDEFKSEFKKVNKRLERMDKSFGNIAEDIRTVIEMVGDTNQKLNKINDKIADHDDILENHERRIDKVEDKVFSTT